jgi:hypothetical protein
VQNLVESRLFAGILNLDTEERNGEHDDEQQDGDEEDRTQYYRGLAGPAALDDTICEMVTISAQTEQANSVTRGRIFHLFVWNYVHQSPTMFG